jgi:hypothetical protein
MSVSGSSHTASNVTNLNRFVPAQTEQSASDAFVEAWKKSWLAGADACWTSQSSVNPNPHNPERAAWQAGWSWAQANPDRRRKQILAHPGRRGNDAPRPVTRAVKYSAWGIGGIGLFAASRWAWRFLRRNEKGVPAKPLDAATPAADQRPD